MSRTYKLLNYNSSITSTPWIKKSVLKYESQFEKDNPRGEGAHVALEERLPHLGDDVGGADHHAADGDQLVDVWPKQSSYSKPKLYKMLVCHKIISKKKSQKKNCYFQPKL